MAQIKIAMKKNILSTKPPNLKIAKQKYAVRLRPKIVNTLEQKIMMYDVYDVDVDRVAKELALQCMCVLWELWVMFCALGTRLAVLSLSLSIHKKHNNNAIPGQTRI